jgi:DNA-directed RNA polymerase specialized sigma24 family protein
MTTDASADALRQFLAATERRAYSLAFRITGDQRSAEEATAAAYAALSPPFAEGPLFEAVRTEALKRAPAQTLSQPATYQLATRVRATFESLPQLERSALELAHTCGMNVQAIAEVLQQEPSAVRGALRSGLLQLGRLAHEEGRTP